MGQAVASQLRVASRQPNMKPNPDERIERMCAFVRRWP